jgi:hypothetical protein
MRTLKLIKKHLHFMAELINFIALSPCGKLAAIGVQTAVSGTLNRQSSGA